MAFSDTIKNARKRALMTQESFAKEIHSSVASINRWENNHGKPNISTMKNIREFCVKYGIPYDEIETDWLEVSGIKDNKRGESHGL